MTAVVDQAILGFSDLQLLDHKYVSTLIVSFYLSAQLLFPGCLTIGESNGTRNVCKCYLLLRFERLSTTGSLDELFLCST